MQYIQWEYLYTRTTESLIVPSCHIECLRIPEGLCSVREVNKKLAKQYVYYWLKFLERGFSSSSVKETRLLTWIIKTECIEICKLADIAVSLIKSTMLSTTRSSSVLKLLVLWLLTIDSDATLLSSTFNIIHSSTTSVVEVDLNRGLLQSSASRSARSWILQLVSPGLRCFQQQYHCWLLKLFVLYLLTIDSDAALVSIVFEITHSSNFESRWLLPAWPL